MFLSNIDKSDNKTIHSYLKQRIICTQTYFEDLIAKNSYGQDVIYSKLLEKNEGRLSGVLDCHK